ncbi:MAG: hypothetical protein RL033_1203 [Pseudomonadota bacterium]|jgi:hypothetical protein
MSRRLTGSRDQAPSSFAPTLGRLCTSAGVLGAVLVDADGEAVDYAGRVDSFEIRVAAAEWRILLARLARSSHGPWRETRQLMVRGAKKSFGAILLPEGYALVLQLLPRCFRVSPRAISEAVREICENAGLALPEEPSAQWRRVQVNESPPPQRRPTSVWVNRKWLPVEVLGRWVGQELLPNEIGYRVRLLGGEEITLVREPLAQWFADPGAALQ